MSDGGADAKVFDQSFGWPREDVFLWLDIRPYYACIERMNRAIAQDPGRAAQIRSLMARAKEGVEQLGIVRVASCECADVVLEVTPSQDLLDFLAEIEAQG